MDENNNPKNTTESTDLTKRQEDLVRLMSVLDECMDSMNNLYYFIKTREMLELSKDN